MGAPKFVFVHNNTAMPTEFAAGPGGARLDFEPGWNKVPGGALDAITGGFDRKGQAKGGIAARYFNEPIEIEPGKFRPPFHIGTPAPGETPREIAPLPGVRSHYRMSALRERDQQAEELRQTVAQLQGQIQALTSGKTNGKKPAVDLPDISGLDIDAIKAATKGLDASSIKQLIADEVIGENRPKVIKHLTARVKKG